MTRAAACCYSVIGDGGCGAGGALAAPGESQEDMTRDG